MLTSDLASNAKGHGFWNGNVDLSSSYLACNNCVINPNNPVDLWAVTVKGRYNPVAAGVYRAGASFWAHPVTQATVFAATSVIGGGIASVYSERPQKAFRQAI